MSEAIVKHQIFEEDEEFFIIYPIMGNVVESENYLGHWHEEIEIVMGVEGRAKHYIDGECWRSGPDRLVVANSESIHNIVIEDCNCPEDAIGALVLLIRPKFLAEYFPEYRNIRFINKDEQIHPEVQKIMMKILCYQQQERKPYDFLYIKGLVLQLLYFLCERGVTTRDKEFPINYQKNIERLRGVFQYVENHYCEVVTESVVARKFYFSPGYFSRYFRKSTGMTFKKYLTEYRLQKAKEDLITSDENILSIALKNGFSDDRRFILSFKEKYHTTPLQYRKKNKKQSR